MWDWIGGRQLARAEGIPEPQGAISVGRKMSGQPWRAPSREALRPVLGDRVDEISDAELIDSIYLTLFPNLHP
jgi:hypothetical protein